MTTRTETDLGIPPHGLLVERLSVVFPSPAGHVHALTDVTFRLDIGQSLCLLGSSGAAKTTLVRALAALLPGSAQVSGEVHLPAAGSLDRLDAARLREYRRTHLGFVFQDAVGSLVPGVAVGRQLERVYRYRRRLDGPQARRASLDALARVGLSKPEDVWGKPPVALSGGMCQRCMIALALAAPKLSFLLADEPVSSLDAVSAAQILNLILSINREQGVTLLWVSHDARIARRFDWVGVLAGGRLLELQRSDAFFCAPGSEEGRALLDASRALGDE